MATNQIPTIDTPFTEAPASWNTRYVTPQGFVCQITLRGESGRELLERANAALSFLLEHGYMPVADNSRGKDSASSKDTRQCPIHKCDMRHFEKDGRSWYSHKLEDGSWCKGKQKGGENG